MWFANALLMVTVGCPIELAREAQKAFGEGRYAEAEFAWRELAEADCDAAQTIANWSSLASTLRSQGKYRESETWFRRALERADQDLKATSKVRAQVLNGAGLLDQELGRWAAAQAKFTTALAIHPAGNNIRANLASLLTRIGNLPAAAELHEQVLRAEPERAVHWINLAMVRRRQGNDREAERLLREALARSRGLAGEMHPETIAARSNLAQVYASRGKRRAAAELMHESVRLWGQTGRTHHPTYARLLGNLGVFYFDQKDYGRARPFLTEAYERFNATLGSQHADTGKAAHDVGMLHHAQRHFDEAARAYEQALQTYAERPELARERMDAWASLGLLHQQMRQPDEAIRCYRELLRLAATIAPGDERRVGRALEHYELLLRQQRNAVEAERVAMISMRFRVRAALRDER